jgi:hypothetical protein
VGVYTALLRVLKPHLAARRSPQLPQITIPQLKVWRIDINSLSPGSCPFTQ